MRTLRIDPVTERVTVEQISPGLDALKASIGCDWIDIRGVGNDQTGAPVDLICDDEGRLAPGKRCFLLGGELLIAGVALLASHDDEGETIGTALGVAQVLETVRWLPEGHDYTPPARLWCDRSHRPR